MLENKMLQAMRPLSLLGFHKVSGQFCEAADPTIQPVDRNENQRGRAARAAGLAELARLGGS
jgi:hypothetical protein